MKITLNNRSEELSLDQSITLSDLIVLKNFTFKFLVTKINGRLIKKDQRSSARIHDGDNVEIIHLISGG